MKTSPPLLAQDVTVLAREDGVFIEFRDDAGAVFAVAGLEVDAAFDVTERLTDACRRVLVGRTPSGAMH